MTVDRHYFQSRVMRLKPLHAGPCQLLLFAHSQAHQHVAGPLRPFMPRIGVIDCLYLVRSFFNALL